MSSQSSSQSTPPNIVSLHMLGLDELQRRWGWVLALGILLVILGMIALGASVVATLASVIFFGWLLIFAGILQSAHAFGIRQWGGFFADLLFGLLYIVVGLMMILHPAAAAIELTLLIALFLFIGGIFRIALAASIRFHHAMWLVIHGVINILLGILIWRQWPLSGLWVIGLFLGIDMLFNGWTLIMLSFMIKNVPGARTAEVRA